MNKSLSSIVFNIADKLEDHEYGPNTDIDLFLYIGRPLAMMIG